MPCYSRFLPSNFVKANLYKFRQRGYNVCGSQRFGEVKGLSVTESFPKRKAMMLMADLRQPLNLSPTRLAIIRLLKEWGKGTANQLSKALGISRVAAHQHLDWLKEQGLVQVRVERKGKGRPAEVFSLTEVAQEVFFPRRYDLLALTALSEVASELGDKFLLRIFRRFRERLVERGGELKGELSERVKAVAKLLEEEGYLAHWEEKRDGFVLSFSNCPIAQISKRFREACVSEEEALTKILGTPVVSECYQASGETACRYFIPKTKSQARQ